MQITMEHLAAIDEAKFDIGKLTIICGDNNSGKTYINYALYGFLDFWWKSFDLVSSVCEEKNAPLDDRHAMAELCLSQKEKILAEASTSFVKFAPDIFASSRDFLSRFKFQAAFPEDRFLPEIFKKELNHQWKEVRSRSRENEDSNRTLRMKWDFVLKKTLAEFLPNPFIITAERSGIMNLWSELDVSEEPWTTFGGQVRERGESTLPLPIMRNIEFARAIRNERFRTPSALVSDHPNFFNDFQPLFGGSFEVSEGTHYFVPGDTPDLKLKMPQSSSSVRSLFMLHYYLKYVAQPGDMIMVDEPELNLHPEKQRLIARLFARLVNYGVKVFATTHSDYLVRELNILLMLQPHQAKFTKIIHQEGYHSNDFLTAESVRTYAAEKSQHNRHRYTLCPMDIDQERGIEVKTFDRTIFRTNNILEKLVYGN